MVEGKANKTARSHQQQARNTISGIMIIIFIPPYQLARATINFLIRTQNIHEA